MSSEAFVTIAIGDDYALGALVLAQSIRLVRTERKLVVLISNEISDSIRKGLKRSFNEVIVADQLKSNDQEHLELSSRAELKILLGKIKCWLLEQYSKCVFLNANCVVKRPIDDLFQREEFSAAPDVSWPDRFNSGVFVYRPSKDTFNKLMDSVSKQITPFNDDGQSFLNSFFHDWHTGHISRHLSIKYNVVTDGFHSYLTAVDQFCNDIHIVHFTGALKPWELAYNPQDQKLSGNPNCENAIQKDFFLFWCRLMHHRVKPILERFNGTHFLSPASSKSRNFTANHPSKVDFDASNPVKETGDNDHTGEHSIDTINEQSHQKIQEKCSRTLTTPTKAVATKTKFLEAHDPSYLLRNNRPSMAFTVSHITSSFKFDIPIRIGFVFDSPDGERWKLDLNQIKYLPTTISLDQLDSRNELDLINALKDKPAGQQLFTITANAFRGFTDDIIFISTGPITITTSNLYQFHLLKMQDPITCSQSQITKFAKMMEKSFN